MVKRVDGYVGNYWKKSNEREGERGVYDDIVEVSV